MQTERRKCLRIRPESGYTCTCTHADLPLSDNLAVRLLDVGRGGACLISSGRLSPRAEVVLDLGVPETLSRLKARATVRWSVTLEKHGRTAHVAGLAFTRILESWGDRRSIFGGPREPETPRPSMPAEPRRRFKRFSPKDLQVVCEPQRWTQLFGFHPSISVRLKDLSQGGLQIAGPKPLEPGLSVELRMESMSSPVPIRAEAQVRWCRRDTRSLEPRWDAGLVFRRMSAPDESRIRDLERFHLG